MITSNLLIFNKINQISRICFFSLVVPYSILAAYYYLARPAGGDEVGFMMDILLIKEQGWLSAIEKNISIPLMLLAVPTSFIFEEIIALRLINVLIICLFLLYLRHQQQKNKSLLFYLVFFICAVAYFYFGTNDTLFIIALSVFFNEVYKASKEEDFNIDLAFLVLIVAIFTRVLFLVYLPIILPGLIILYQLKKNQKIRFSFNLTLLIFFITLNVPSLLENGTISYDKKAPPNHISSSWVQRQYLAQIQQNEGIRKFQTHPSWEETDEYLKENGSHSLPRSSFKSLIHNIPLTIKEFFKDLIYIAVFHTRSLGIMLIVVLFLYFLNLFSRTNNLYSFFAPFAVLTMILVFALITISYVEMRWLGSMFILTIIVYSDLESTKKFPKWIFSINYSFLSFLIIYGSYGLINNLIQKGLITIAP